jgi:AraC-like DNA-binding protein
MLAQAAGRGSTMTGKNQHHYHPVDDLVSEWGFYLTTTGRVLEPSTTQLPHGVHPDMYMFDVSPARADAARTSSPRECGRILPEFQVIYIAETHAVFESDETGVVEFDGPTLLFLFPGVWHRYRPVGFEKSWLTMRWIGFNGDLAYRLAKQHTITPASACRPAARPEFLAATFDRLIDRAANPAADPVLLSIHAMDLLADCIESVQDESTESCKRVMRAAEHGGDDMAARMLDLIWTGSHRGMSTEQMCKLLGVKRRTVERKFREARGHSLLTEVNLCRCRRARHLLEKTDLPIKNICWLAGFSNLEQMRVNFLQHLGSKPSDYRQARR